MNLTMLHQIANRCIKKCQSMMGISTLGARAIVLNSEDKVLLVKHTYQSYWYLPGGGVKKNEPIKTALVRELKEEVGITVLGEPELFGIYYHTYLGVPDYPVIYIVKNYSIEKTYSPEIEKIDWFSYSNLPEVTSPGTSRRLKEYFDHVPRVNEW